MDRHKAEAVANESPMVAAYDEVRARLMDARLRILTEIQHYPTPIPHCDQHFNWLLEQRDNVSAELNALDDLRERAVAALIEFVQASRFVEADIADPLPC